ncbi:hypothetical protein EV424DRAFT_1345692 [Suillus variegatus]|nr:hypothetical protein EV424DRAFT_1345692 [Suillus variegatus]
MKLHSVDGFGDLADSSVLDDATLGMKVTTKPGGRITVMFLQAFILALIPAIRLADARTPTWITTSSLSDLLSEKKSIEEHYVALMQNLYAVAVASGSTTPSHLSTHLIQALFLNLRDMSLMFLLGVLLVQSPALEHVRTRALLHALVFLRGHNSDNAVDFQTVLPSFIAMLMDARTDKQGHALIFECISMLVSTLERKHVYGLDTIYGAESMHLQYLDAKDLKGYLKALLECHTLLVQDGNYIKIFHQQHFAAASAKRRVISTFMGTNVFHRNDSYSFKVMQNTIENIVPVMVSSLKSRHPPGLELYIGAREFLRIFMDTSNHIPRHCRQNADVRASFFIHLADVLGPQEFLAPVCMSLVDRVANWVLKEVLREAQRLIRNIACSDEAGATFLDYIQYEDQYFGSVQAGTTTTLIASYC